MRDHNKPIYEYMRRYNVTLDEVWLYRHETDSLIDLGRASQLARRNGMTHILSSVKSCRRIAMRAAMLVRVILGA